MASPVTELRPRATAEALLKGFHEQPRKMVFTELLAILGKSSQQAIAFMREREEIRCRMEEIQSKGELVCKLEQYLSECEIRIQFLQKNLPDSFFLHMELEQRKQYQIEINRLRDRQAYLESMTLREEVWEDQFFQGTPIEGDRAQETYTLQILDKMFLSVLK